MSFIKKIIVKKIFGLYGYFFKTSAKILSKHKKIKKYAINFAKNKQLLYWLIYNQDLLELKILKFYIKKTR